MKKMWFCGLIVLVSIVVWAVSIAQWFAADDKLSDQAFAAQQRQLLGFMGIAVGCTGGILCAQWEKYKLREQYEEKQEPNP